MNSAPALNAGLIGFGLAGRILHAPLLRAAGIDIQRVVSSRAAEVHALLPEAQCHADIDSLLAPRDVELVVVCSPNHLHREQCLAALNAGCHVVVEKPFARDVAEADEIIAAARSAGRELFVFHNRRWDSDFLTLQGLLRGGQLGELRSLQLRWDRFRPQRAERWREHAEFAGGVLFDLGAHQIDQALRIAGRPDWIWATLLRQRAGATVEDGFELQMQAGPVHVSLGVSTLAADPGLRIRALGTAGSFLSSAIDVQEQQLRDGVDPRSAHFGVVPEADFGWLYRGADARNERVASERGSWLDFYLQVLECIRMQKPAPVSGAQGREVIELIEAARLSSQTGCRVVLAASAATAGQDAAGHSAGQ